MLVSYIKMFPEHPSNLTICCHNTLTATAYQLIFNNFVSITYVFISILRDQLYSNKTMKIIEFEINFCTREKKDNRHLRAGLPANSCEG